MHFAIGYTDTRYKRSQKRLEASENVHLDITTSQHLPLSEQAYHIVYKAQEQHFQIYLDESLVFGVKTTAHYGLKGKTEQNRTEKMWTWLKS